VFLKNLVENLHSSVYRYTEVLEYLHQRGVTDQNIEEYKVGFNRVVSVVDDGSEDRKRFMEETNKGKSIEGSIIFPITDVFGRYTGIIGRTLSPKIYRKFFSSEAKFIGCFFNIEKALPEIYRTGVVFVTEGVFDCIPLANIIPNTLASLTVGLTDNQYEFLNFFCKHIVTVFDSDKAGEIETQKAMRKWNNVFPMKLGSYKDPSVCRSAMSANEFESFVKKLTERRLTGLVKGGSN